MDVIAFLRKGVFVGDVSMSRAIDDCSAESSVFSSDDWHVIDSIIGLELPITLNHLFNILALLVFFFKSWRGKHQIRKIAGVLLALKNTNVK